MDVDLPAGECKNCGSENLELKEAGSDSRPHYRETPHSRTVLVCQDCGQRQDRT